MQITITECFTISIFSAPWSEAGLIAARKCTILSLSLSLSLALFLSQNSLLITIIL